MAPKIEDDWSDSDDGNDDLSDVETSVLLGIPDGPITSSSDIGDAAVSRIGGHPVRINVSYILINFLTCLVHEGVPSVA
jgi:pre-rRNA-processing protein TSR4